MDPIRVHVGDDAPSLYLRLKDQDNDCYIDLSPATTLVYAKFRAKNTDTVLQTILCTKIQGGYYGLVRMDWPADSLDVDAGRYEIEVYTDTDGVIQTANRYYMTISAYDDDTILELKLVDDF